MAQKLYIAAAEPDSGKSLIALGLMELVSRKVHDVSFFRPVIRGGDLPDREIELMRQRYRLDTEYETNFGVTYDQARQLVADGRTQQLLKRILAKFRQLEDQSEFVLCEGTDFTGVGAAFEFDFNAQVAGHLGCPVVPVSNGVGKSAEEIVDSVLAERAGLAGQRCVVAATMINRVPAELVDEVQQRLAQRWSREDPIYVLPEKSTLSNPTIGEIVASLGGRLLYGEQEWLHRVSRDYKVAAMHVPHFLDHIRAGSLVITPGDRSDVILASLASVHSENFPNISGIVLTGGLSLAPQMERLMQGSRSEIPIISVEADTYATAMQISALRAGITADNQRKIALALGTFESHVDLEELKGRIAISRSARVTPLMFEYELIERAKAQRQHIVLPEGNDVRILRAAEILLRRDVVDITLLGEPTEIRERIAGCGLDLEHVRVVDPEQSEWREDFAATYFELRRHKGITEQVARDVVCDVSYFGTLMVHKGLVDGMVSGAAHTTADTIRPAFQIIRTPPGVSIVSSVFLMCVAGRVLVYGDCAVNPRPNPQQLADIAISSAKTAQMFGIEPRVAMLSYSTGESGKGEEVEKVREATQLARQQRPDLKIDGPIQYDAAIDAGVAQKKLPNSEVAGRATVFIFPDLNTGNNTYKAVQRSSGAIAIGPVLQGLNKPINDLSRGCTVPDIVNTVAITAMQAQAAKENHESPRAELG